jgi:hypothetical protein
MKKLNSLGLFCLMVLLLLLHTFYSCSDNMFLEGLSSYTVGDKKFITSDTGSNDIAAEVEQIATGTIVNGEIAYNPSTFEEFQIDLNGGYITKGGNWFYTPQPGQIGFTPMIQSDGDAVEQAYTNQSRYTASTPWSEIRKSVTKTS